MKVFRLNHLLKTGQRIIVKSVKNGKVDRSMMTLEVGKTYVLGDIDEESLLERTTEVKWSKEVEDYLKSEGAEYSIIKCKVCGGRSKRISLPTIEIFEADPNEWEEV